MVLANEGFREHLGVTGRRCQTGAYRFSKTILGIDFSPVYGYKRVFIDKASATKVNRPSLVDDFPTSARAKCWLSGS